MPDPEAFRTIPPVHRLVSAVQSDPAANGVSQALVVEAAREVIESHRLALGNATDHVVPPLGDLARAALEALRARDRPALEPMINATGIILHTGLGRAPLPASAARAAADIAAAYAPVELDLESGDRGSRSEIVRELLRRLTGAEAATVVNNNAGALVLVLAALAHERGVVVSRGELIEIGGSFRLPDIMKVGGAVLREVGTTNRTRLRDYERGLGLDGALLLKVHPSNYRLEGFQEAVPLEELVALGRRRRVPVVYDIGSGALVPTSTHGLPSQEPDAATAIREGADLVLFSGDKLLGGPQAGIIVGRRDLVSLVQSHPLMRALRLDKIRLAALAETLRLHRDIPRARHTVPVLALASTPLETLERRARAIAERLGDLPGLRSVTPQPAPAFMGGGSLPAHAIASIALRLESTRPEHAFARHLRQGRPAVLTRVSEGAVWCNLRTVFEDQDTHLTTAIQAAARRT